jgi:hypothetical protein
MSHGYQQIQGPWGGRVLGPYGGSPFFDGPATGIKGLKIKSKSGVLWSLSVEYDACGQSFQSVPHGEPPPRVKDLQEDEVSFTCISQGFFGLFMLNMMYVANHFNSFPMVDLTLVVETKLTKTK